MDRHINFVDETTASSSDIDENKLKEFLGKVPSWEFAEISRQKYKIFLEKIKTLY